MYVYGAISYVPDFSCKNVENKSAKKLRKYIHG
jgi:hypothetical protein